MKILYWIGCMASYRTPEIAKSTFSILNKLRVNFLSLGQDEGCCGSMLLRTGLIKEAKTIATKNVKNCQNKKFKRS